MIYGNSQCVISRDMGSSVCRLNLYKVVAAKEISNACTCTVHALYLRVIRTLLY